MSGAVQQTLMFIIQFLFGLYSFMLVLRVWIRMNGIQANHPLLVSIAKLTNPLVNRLKKWIPDVAYIEISGITLLLGVTLVKLLLVSAVAWHVPHIPGLFAWTLISAVEVFLDVVFYAMIIFAILSWIPNVQPELYSLLSQITAPLLMPIRRCLPLFGGLDLSPVVLLLLVQVLEMLLVHPVMRASLMATFQT
ncbi:MAG: YggT family protein [Gammaproteobacteria bacterium]|nr:YggT family protein [Gammaproteobacteria bacterium]MCD8525272.1 YggT family protein [Gammaproteobacteria bacterium]MCD8542450.1 YggT family protein [Gammaproteobacteria bacterium]